MTHLWSTGVTEFVVGFAMDDYGRVALIEKNRPAWQAGKLNGIGGHVEDFDESHLDAMRREFWEETGLFVNDWDLIVTMRFPGAVISFFRSWITPKEMESLKTMTDEEVRYCSINSVILREDIIPNLSWLIPLAWYQADSYQPIDVIAKNPEAQ